MKAQACEPCAKRKVRCDRDEPCSNCKRRKQDHCIYPEISPHDRIKALETQVKDLGGDPDKKVVRPGKINDTTTQAAKAQAGLSNSGREAPSYTAWGSKDSVILEENGKSFYLESRAWQTWMGKDDGIHRDTTRHPLLTRDHPNALQGLLRSPSSMNLVDGYPVDDDARILWKLFNKRVYPLVKISFNWALNQLRSDSMNLECRSRFTDAEHAFMFSLYLISITSMSDEECRRDLRQSRAILLSEYERLCQEAFLRTNIFCITDIQVLKATVLYMMAGIDRMNTQSLWSLMGMVSRNAEKLGIHRDGTLLDLSPAETEDRRRLWWQLQHIDLILAVRSGVTPLTLMADWDAKLPLNIEDQDINTNMTDFPKERKGLTNMSYCRWTYWVLNQQRSYFHSQKEGFKLSWQSNKSVPLLLKDSLIKILEDGINENFLQYCDPIKPLDILIQLSGRALVCMMRQRALSPLAHGGDQGYEDEEHRDALISACIRSLEYNIAMYSHPSIKQFQWWTQGFFAWHGFMCVLVEISQENLKSRTQQLWDLLSNLYSAHSNLLHLSEDRRKLHAAEIVVAAWKARQKRDRSNGNIQKPDFVVLLETKLSEYRAELLQNSREQATGIGKTEEFLEPENILAEHDMEAIFDFDFQDIDWSFWSSID